MSARRAVGVWGMGVHLPPVRDNGWWSAELVARWKAHEDAGLDRGADTRGEVFSPRAQVILQEMAALRGDPFRGTRERRVLPDHLAASSMERIAAAEALAQAGVGPERIGMLIGCSSLPDHLLVPQPCRMHAELGLPRQCMTLTLDSAQNSFLHQLALASEWIACGRIDHALLVQSSGWTRYFRPESPTSAWIGDGASAVVLGPVADGYGILGQHHITDGALAEGLAFGVPGKRWYDEGRVEAYHLAHTVARQVLTESVAALSDCGRAAIADARLAPSDIDVFAAYQAFVWMRRVTQAFVGVERARSVDTFPWAANTGAVNVPLSLVTLQREGLLGEGDRTLLLSGGAGVTHSAVVVRWGGRVLT